MPAVMHDRLNGPSLSTHKDDVQGSASTVEVLAPHDICVHQLVQQQCETYPDSPAVHAWDGNLTYRELDQRSSRLANVLLQHGAGPEMVVPLCFDKSMWTAVAIVATLKAGGAFFLLDLAFPLNRLREMCSTVNAPIVLTSSARAELASSLISSGAKITVDDDSYSVTHRPDDTESSTCSNSAKPENACYVVFTSGSTGKPKGIVVPHRAMATSITKIQNPLFLQRDSRVLQFASHAFDLSVYDHLFTLATGACLCIPSETARQSALAETFAEYSVNWVTLTPSVARMLASERLPGLKTLALAGEAITRTDLDKWIPHVRLLGLYGPAEFVGPATIRDFTASSTDPANLGYSYNAVCWVVDSNNHTCLSPDGQEGELILEGPCLSRGYIDISASSSAAFFDAAPWLPSSRSLNNQLYRTGDIVSYNQDGSFQFLGRKDNQVKLSGQRIELGEVEYHLKQAIPEAMDIVVEVVSSSKQGTTSLIAFIQFSSWNAHSYLEAFKDVEFQRMTTKARDYLRQHLPPYMVPGDFLLVHHIPMTGTGKTDRKTLRRQAEQLFVTRMEQSARHYIEYHGASTTAVPDTLRMLCEKTLGFPLQSLRDDVSWLQLGGDSLLAMKLVDQARNHGLSMSVPDILESRSLAQLALKLKREETAPTLRHVERFGLLPTQTEMKKAVIRNALEQCQVPMNSLEDLYPCTAHQLLMMPYLIKGRCNSTLRLRCPLPANVDHAKFVRAWYYVVTSNPVFRTRIIEAGEGVFFQAVMRDPVMLDLRPDPGKPTTGPVVDLFGVGVPLVRACFLENIFVMSMHHLLFDGYSYALALKDIERAYEGQALPCLSFSLFVQWSETLDDQNTKYWTSSFAGFEGKHFPPVPSPEYMPLETAALYRELRVLSRDEFTVSNKLRLALAVTLARNLGVDKIAYGDLLARRAVPITGISDMAVPTASVLPICVRLDMQGSLRSNLERIQRDAAERLDFEGVHKGLLRGLNAEARAVCDYQTVLNIQAEGTDTFPGMFNQATTVYGKALGLWSLLVECWLTSSSGAISLRFDENVVSKERMSRFFDCFEFVFQTIARNPTLSPTDLQADFDF